MQDLHARTTSTASPKSERDEQRGGRAAARRGQQRAAGGRRAARRRGGDASASRPPSAPSAIRPLAWERAIAGQPSGAFKPYRITLTFGEGELIHHSKFGDGVVAKVIDRRQDRDPVQGRPRTMAHGQP